MQFEQAITLCSDEMRHSELLLRAQQQLTCCKEKRDEDEIKIFHQSWQSFRPKPPRLVKKQKTDELDKDDLIEENQREISGQIISSPKGLLCLKYTGPLSGWTIELTKDVSIGEHFLPNIHIDPNFLN